MSGIWFIPKDLLVKVEQIDSEFKLETICGTSFGLKGDYIATNKNGEKYIIEKNEFEKKYIKVKLMEDSKINKLNKEKIENAYKNYFEETIASAWKGKVENWDELQDIVKERNKNKQE